MRYRDACVMKLRYLVAMVRKFMPVRVNAVPGNIPPRIGLAPSGSTATGLATQKPLETRLEITVESSPLHVANGNPRMGNMNMISGHLDDGAGGVLDEDFTRFCRRRYARDGDGGDSASTRRDRFVRKMRAWSPRERRAQTP